MRNHTALPASLTAAATATGVKASIRLYNSPFRHKPDSALNLRPSANTAPFAVAPVFCVLGPAVSVSVLEAWRKGLPSGAQVLALPRTAAALRQFAKENPGRDAVLLEAQAILPPFWRERLFAAAVASPSFGVVCALDAASLGFTDAIPAQTLDARCWSVSEREAVPTQHLGMGLSYWRAAALAMIGAEETTLAIPFGVEAAWLDHLLVSGNASTSANFDDDNAVAALRARLVAAFGDDENNPSVPPYFGLDGKPVVLHVLHGWGGGAQRFVADLSRADVLRHHLVFMAKSVAERKLAGVALELLAAPDAAPLRSVPLDAPVQASIVSSPETRALQDRVLRDFSVTQIVVSSLIGHSLDVLRTGLPTLIACHDYYPLWPALHDDFDDATRDFSTHALADPLKRKRVGFPEQRLSAWRTLREAYVAALLETRPTLVSPSTGVLHNLARIEPRLAALPSRTIPHGLAPWRTKPATWKPPKRDGLRVLVAGRINGSKGEELIDALLPLLDPRIELVLAGAGAAAMRFFGTARVNVLMDYAHADLPRLIAQLKPDLALLPSTVPETFSYTLSELWSLRVPVLAPKRGAFAERIEDGLTGLLCEPGAKAIAARLNTLLQDRAPLEKLRKAKPDIATLETMGKAWDELLTSHATPTPQAPSHANLTAAAQRHALEAQRQSLSEQFAQAAGKVKTQQKELDARAEWAAALAANLDERTRWSLALQGETDDLKHALADLREEFDHRSQWAQQLDEQRQEAARHLTTLQAEYDERTRWALTMQEDIMQLRQEFTQIIDRLTTQQEDNQRLSQQLVAQEASNRELAQQRDVITQQRDDITRQLHDTEQELQRYIGALTAQRDEFESERNRMLASRSWKLTKPLRFATRLLHGLMARLDFRAKRTSANMKRAFTSLRMRGLRGTLARARQELSPAPVLTTPTIIVPQAADAGVPIVLPRSDAPRVSVVIPVYNHLDATLICLRSLAATNNAIAHEIIVVDDCSSDETAQALPGIAGLRYQRNAQNLGFIGACNAGAAQAAGEFVVFLNNDTAVQDHWLDALIDTFTQHRDVGLVGAKLVYPDGRLQEAGGIVFSDGSGWNYGRFDDPSKPEYNFVREVDYCSGAAIALRTELFHQFGGFDTHYAPAYYEDTDLAMKVRQAGLRVLYQPASVVVHYEGISSGTDVASGTKRYQVINQVKFLERWHEALARHAEPGTDIAIARQHRARKRVLVIDATTPQPDQDSGSLRLSNILQLLLDDGCAVTFFADNRAYVERYSAALQQMGVEVLWHPWLADPVAWFAENGKRYGVVFVSRHYIACQYVSLVRANAPKAKLIFDTVDLHYLREQRAAELAQDETLVRTAAQTRDAELKLVRDCDLTLVVSPVEKALLEREIPGAKVAILSNVHAVPGCRRAYAQREGILFVGGYQHPPNVDAATWFAREIFPLVRRELPDVQFHLVGSKATPEVKALGELEGVDFIGYAPDIEPYLDGCRIAVAPLRYGAGVKGKVNMSMSYGQPVVATPVAVEGMFAEPGRDVLVASDAADFAAKVIAAYQDEVLWNTLSEHGAANVREHFSFEAALAALRRIVD